MFSKSMLAMAGHVLAADLNYGKQLARVPIVDPAQALGKLEAGDILVQFAPQLKFDKDYYNEHMLKGCMHIATVATCGGKPFKVELMQQGIFVVDDLFGDLDGEVIYLKRYNLVLRHKKLARDAHLRQAVGESVFRLAGFEDHGGVPVRTRRVFVNFFLKTHRPPKKKRRLLPDKVYCSEITYLAYREHGIEICKLASFKELLEQAGGFPEREVVKKIVKRYTKTSMSFYRVLMLMGDLERLGILLRAPFLRPMRLVFDRVVLPQFILENPAFEVVMAVPPPAVYITQWQRMLQFGEGMESEIAG